MTSQLKEKQFTLSSLEFVNNLNLSLSLGFHFYVEYMHIFFPLLKD